jgi:hypothetical protein
MASGDHIRVNRGLYWHHGIDLGDDTVIHAAGEPGRRKIGAIVRCTSMGEFLRGGRAVRVEAFGSLPVEEVVQRARRALGQGGYSLLFNNCEHFAYWCQTGQLGSRQVERAALTGTMAGLAVRLAMSAAARGGGATLLLRAVQLTNPIPTSLAIVGTAVMVASQAKRLWTEEASTDQFSLPAPSNRHARESGHPGGRLWEGLLDSRFRGNDEFQAASELAGKANED